MYEVSWTFTADEAETYEEAALAACRTFIRQILDDCAERPVFEVRHARLNAPRLLEITFPTGRLPGGTLGARPLARDDEDGDKKPHRHRAVPRRRKVDEDYGRGRSVVDFCSCGATRLTTRLGEPGEERGPWTR